MLKRFALDSIEPFVQFELNFIEPFVSFVQFVFKKTFNLCSKIFNRYPSYIIHHTSVLKNSLTFNPYYIRVQKKRPPFGSLLFVWVFYPV